MTAPVSQPEQRSQGARTLIVGSSDGIGLALARRLLADGHLVTSVSRSPSPIDAGARYEHVVSDVRDADYPAKLRDISQRRGPFAVCIYCAGIGDLFDASHLEREADVFRVNLVGAVLTLAEVVPPMLAQGEGHFVALSSIADEMISAEAPSYAASKAGLSSYLAGVALALRPRGVAVSNVRLGFVDTKMAKSRRRPLMMPVERAVEVIARCLKTRRPRVTRPMRMGLLVKVLRVAALLKLGISARRTRHPADGAEPSE